MAYSVKDPDVPWQAADGPLPADLNRWENNDKYFKTEVDNIKNGTTTVASATSAGTAAVATTSNNLMVTASNIILYENLTEVSKTNLKYIYQKVRILQPGQYRFTWDSKTAADAYCAIYYTVHLPDTLTIADNESKLLGSGADSYYLLYTETVNNVTTYASKSQDIWISTPGVLYVTMFTLSGTGYLRNFRIKGTKATITNPLAV